MRTLTDNIKAILALFIVITTYIIFIMILLIYRKDINVVSQVVIAVVGGFTGVTGYFYGYSQGAAKKDETIATISANKKTDPPNTTINNNVS